MGRAIEIGDGKEVRLNRFGKPALCKTRPSKFGVKKRAAFLRHLAGSCNVRAAAKAAECSVGAVYYWRGADAEFSAAFDRALEAGYMQLEFMLIERARSGDSHEHEGGECADLPDPANMDTDLGLRLLGLHHRKVKATSRTGGPARRKASREETDAVILQRLKVLGIRFEYGED